LRSSRKQEKRTRDTSRKVLQNQLIAVRKKVVALESPVDLANVTQAMADQSHRIMCLYDVFLRNMDERDRKTRELHAKLLGKMANMSEGHVSERGKRIKEMSKLSRAL
jgi:hypothetical protein